MTTRQSIEAAIAALDSIEGVDPYLSFTFSTAEESKDVWAAVKAMGGHFRATLYKHSDKISVIEGLRLYAGHLGHIEVNVQHSREATMAERERDDISCEHRDSYDTVAL